MKADRTITAAGWALGVVTFALSMGVTGRAAAQTSGTLTHDIVWVGSHPARPGLPLSTQAPDGTSFDPWHAYTPAEFCAAYAIDQLHAEGITGGGQTIVIVGCYGSPTVLEDLKAFCDAFALPVPDLTIVYPGGNPPFSNAQQIAGHAHEAWAQEISLDLQWAHAVAPDAKLVLIVTNPSEVVEGVGAFPNLFKGIAYAVEHYPGSPVSQSWAVDEQSFRSAGEEQVARFHKVYEQAAAARCTVLSASGDEGTANFDKQPWRLYPSPTVMWPASDPLVTSVGGTWLQYGWRWDPLISIEAFCVSFDVASYLNWVDDIGGRTEAVWKEDWFWPLTGAAPATGGGLSALFPTPEFQQDLPQSLLQGRRGLPDISCNAAVNGGVLTYYTGGWAPQPYPGPWGLVGGTSASTPELAGLVALTNQLRSQMGKQPIGYLNPVLYTLPPRDFNDIVPQTFGEGSGVTVVDDNSRFGSGIPGGLTTPGWDLTTGLGSPNAYWFVHDLADTP